MAFRYRWEDGLAPRLGGISANELKDASEQLLKVPSELEAASPQHIAESLWLSGRESFFC
jgi:hypothetical protein